MMSRALRFKRFPRGPVAWVLSIGSHDGKRLNVSFHRKPNIARQ